MLLLLTGGAIHTMRSSDALKSFSAFANSVLYSSSSGRSGLVAGADFSFAGVDDVAVPAVAIAAALGVARSAMLSSRWRPPIPIVECIIQNFRRVTVLPGKVHQRAMAEVRSGKE